MGTKITSHPSCSHFEFNGLPSIQSPNSGGTSDYMERLASSDISPWNGAGSLVVHGKRLRVVEPMGRAGRRDLPRPSRFLGRAPAGIGAGRPRPGDGAGDVRPVGVRSVSSPRNLDPGDDRAVRRPTVVRSPMKPGSRPAGGPRGSCRMGDVARHPDPCCRSIETSGHHRIIPLDTEPARIRGFYEVRARRVEPIGLACLWPDRG